MKEFSKYILLIAVAGLLNACATSPVAIDQRAFNSNKIQELHIQPLKNNITPVKQSTASIASTLGAGLIGSVASSVFDAGVHLTQKQKLNGMLERIKDYDVNVALKNILADKLQGEAFSDDLTIRERPAQATALPLMTPSIKPKVVMSKNYTTIGVVLDTRTLISKSQAPFKSAYFSERFIDESIVSDNKNDNKQYWVENPDVLINKIESGLAEIAQQFADEYNGENYKNGTSRKITRFK
jgi:hypothetical protein